MRGFRMAAGVFVTSLAVLLIRFLVPSPVGIADNGDGWRLLCRLGGGNEGDNILERYVQFVYTPTRPCDSQYISSQLWLDKLAQLFSGNATLNLYALGVLCCLIAAAGIALIVVSLGVSRRMQFVAAALLLLVVADSAFFGYFASILSEGAVFLGVLLLVGGLLLLQRADHWRYTGAVVTVLGALLAVNAKTQGLLIVPLLFIVLLAMRQDRVLRIAVALAIGLGTVLMQQTGSPAGNEYREANAYHTIFDSIVDGKHDTKGDLAALGLPESFAKYVGTTWWSEGTGRIDPEYPAYQHLISRRNIAKYYLTHPWRTVQILQQAATDQLTARPPNLGSYGPDSGEPPMAKEYRVPVFSGVAGLLAPFGLFFLVPMWGLTAWGAWRSRRSIALIVWLLLGNAVGQFLMAALAEGIEGVKHQIISLFCGLLAVVLVSVAGRDRHRLVAREVALEPEGERSGLPDKSPSGQPG